VEKLVVFSACVPIVLHLLQYWKFVAEKNKIVDSLNGKKLWRGRFDTLKSTWNTFVMEVFGQLPVVVEESLNMKDRTTEQSLIFICPCL
jgi:hypothetical protein